jgi:hypothetical protein
VKQSDYHRLLVVTDREALGDTIVRIAEQLLGRELVLATTYTRCEIQLTELVEDNDLFVLELLRQYPGGVRAEGVALAQRLFRRGKAVLIVSPLFLPDLQTSGYWDVAAKDSLGERLERFVRNPGLAMEKFNSVMSCFRRLLELPPQHKSR